MSSEPVIPLRRGLLSLSPLVVFVCLYLATSLIVRDFYKVPITVAFLLSSVYAVMIMRGSIKERVEVFSRGAGHPDVMLMLWIFILAGAFASSAKAMGAVDATVNLTLRLLPDTFLLPGIFLAACVVSFAIGTSVGTVVALTPVAAGLAQASGGVSLGLVVAIVLGGAYFGDNLSFISDTTIVATQTQGCRMSDKFRANFRLVVPMALLVFVIYFLQGRGLHVASSIPEVDVLRVLPYLLVIVTAVLGLNVMLVLLLGLLLTGIVGMSAGAFTLFGWFQSMADGMTGMAELMIMTLLAGGMFAIIQHTGGITFLIQRLTRRIKGRRGAETSISLLVCLINICTANNTVAIMSSGSIARDVAHRYGIDPRRTACLLDTTSCATQAFLPYGAQMLMAAGLAQVNPLDIIPWLHYPLALVVAVVLSIVFQLPRQYRSAHAG